jgi:hypothetical protein
MPELFAFSLLEEFDVRELVALAAPRPVGWREARERIDSELRPLAEWRELFEPRVKESR